MNSSNPAADLDLDGLSTAEAKNAAIAWLERRSLGQRQVCILDCELHGYYPGGCTTIIFQRKTTIDVQKVIKDSV